MKRSIHDSNRTIPPIVNNNTSPSSSSSTRVKFNDDQLFRGRRYIDFEKVVPTNDTDGEQRTIESSSSSSHSHQVLEINEDSMQQIIQKRMTLKKLSTTSANQRPSSSSSLSGNKNMLDQFAVEEEYNSMPDSSIAKQRRRVYEKNIQINEKYKHQHILFVQDLEVPYSDPMKYISNEDRLLMFRNSVTETFILNFQPFIISERNRTGPENNNIWDSEFDCRFIWKNAEHMKTYMEMYDCEFTGKLIPVRLSSNNNHSRVKVIFNFNIIDTMTEFNDKPVFVTIVIDIIPDKTNTTCFQFVTYFFNICKNDVYTSS